MPNPEKKYAKIALIVTIAAVGLIFLPGLIGWDGMEGGFAVSFVGLWLALSGAIVTIFLRQRAARLERLLKKIDLLAHWTYTKDEWLAYSSAELGEQLQDNRALWLIIGGFSLVAVVVVWVADPEAGPTVAAIMLGVVLLLAAVAFGLPYLRRNRRRKQPGEVWLASTAVYFDGVFYPWDTWESRLQQVELRPAEGAQPAELVFDFVYVISSGIQEQALRIPVPLGRLSEAQALLEHFKTTSKN